MSKLLYRIGGWAARWRFSVLIAWILLLAAIFGGGLLLGPRFDSSFSIPGTPAQVALDMLEQRFPPAASNASIKVIYIAPDGGSITTERAAIERADAKLLTVDGVDAVMSPFNPTVDQPGQAISHDGSMAYATLTMNVPQSSLTQSQYNDVQKAAIEGISGTELTLAYSGVPNEPGHGDLTEAIGLVISFVVLAITFGALLAAGMPLIMALISVLITDGLITLGSQAINLSSTTPLLAEMLGLAVGIDYALFILARHRTQVAHGMAIRESIAVATATAGTAVMFAGATVVIALLGLLVVGIPFLSAMGIGAAAGVIISMLAAITLLPALLSLGGKKLVPKPTSRAYRRETAAVPRTMGARWVKLITRRPLVTLLIAAAALIAIALPALNMRLALPDAGADPAGSVTRTGYDAIADGWGPGANGPLIAIADISHTDVTKLAGTLTDFSDTFKNVKGVASVSPAYPNPTLDAAIVSITPTTSPDSLDTEALVHELRDNAASFEKQNGYSYDITGQTALNIDISQVLSGAIGPFAIIVVGLSLVLLLIVFRSVAVPLSATFGFLLSVAAAFGVTSAIFQQGFGAELFGLAKPGPIISFMPIMVMAVLFGLAMDYQVFLVSRISEHYVATRNAKESVTHGFTASARVVVAAALIMAAVFFSFVPGGAATIQSMALALAVGVLFDALIVRMTIIPAFMWLMGDHGWWLPKALRSMPDVDIEGAVVERQREAWEWQRSLPASVTLAIDSAENNLHLRAKAGDVVEILADPHDELTPILAAISGRGTISGDVSVLGKPLPFDAAEVRRRASLVLLGTKPVAGELGRQLRSQLALNGRRPQGKQIDQVLGLAREIAEVANITPAGMDLTTDAAELTADQIWAVDLAIAVTGNEALVVCDARQLTRPGPLLSLLVRELGSDVSLVVGLQSKVAVTGRRVVASTVFAGAEVSA
ncbi:MAG: MMPL family transporter [Actinobacteria bacterium]|uniref:Unannotated protein n=1 Tax=freshwater metagenome TaxID=449393 RepID=A0A6J7FCJ9_9ZZZZ|nr:MMPL family transporter [Actinomycetota bacterium]